MGRALTFEKLLLAVLFVQVDDDGPRGLLGLPLAARDEALLERQQAIHLVAHEQHAAVTTPLLHHLRPRCCRSDRRTAKTMNDQLLLNKTKYKC